MLGHFILGMGSNYLVYFLIHFIFLSEILNPNKELIILLEKLQIIYKPYTIFIDKLNLICVNI